MDPRKDEFDRGLRVSVFEAAAWMTALGVLLAAPAWVGIQALVICFYGVLCALTWRLSKAIAFSAAIFISLVIAAIITGCMVACFP